MLPGDLLNPFEDEGISAETILRVGDLAMVATIAQSRRSHHKRAFALVAGA